MGQGIRRLTGPLAQRLTKLLPTTVLKRVLRSAVESAPAQNKFDHDPADFKAARTAALKIETRARAMNTASGAAAGFGGLWTTGADIPASLALAMNTISDIGRAYGFEEDTKVEKTFRLQILELATCDEPAHRQRLLDKLDEAIGEDGSLSGSNDETLEPIVDQIVERVARGALFALVRRRAGTVVPIVGTALGAAINNSFQRDVAKAARYAYQARALKREGS